MSAALIYKKINELRAKVKEKGIKRNGEKRDNGVVIYNYYLLEDILDVVYPMLSDLGLCPCFSLTIDQESGMYDANLIMFMEDGSYETQFHVFAPINESKNSLANQTPLQAAGSNNTSQHKYCWINILGLGSDTKQVDKDDV